HVTPDGSWIRFELLRERVCLGGLLLRHIESLNGRVEYRVARRSELLRHGTQDSGAVVRGVRVECCADVVQRRRPRILNRRAHVPAPEASDVLKAPDDVIATDQSKQEHIQGEGGGTDIAVPENESAEQTGMRAVRGIVEIAVAVHEEQEHVSVSQVGAGRNLLGAELAVLVSEREVPGRVLGHEVKHPARELAETPVRQSSGATRRFAKREIVVHRLGPELAGLDGALFELLAPRASGLIERVDAGVSLVGWARGPFAMSGVRGDSGHTSAGHTVLLSTGPGASSGNGSYAGRRGGVARTATAKIPAE